MKWLQRVLRRLAQHRPQRRQSVLPGQNYLHNREDGPGLLLSLPIELLLRVFEYLSPSDLLHCRFICRWFKEVIDQTPEVQYKIELHALGCENNDACTDMNTSERLEALRAQAQFWKNPQFSWKAEDVPWSHGDLRYNHFHENLWVRSLNIGWTEQPWKFNAIQCVALEPTRDGSSVLDSWKHVFPFAFDCYMSYPSRCHALLLDSMLTSDPQCYRIRKVSLSSGEVLSEDVIPIEGPRFERWAGPVMDSACGHNISVVRSALLPDTGMAILCITIVNFDAMKMIVNTSLEVQDDSLIAIQLVRDDCLLLHIMRGGVFMTKVFAIKPRPSIEDDAHALYPVTTFHYPDLQPSWVEQMTDMNFIVGGSGGGLVSRNVPPRPFIRASENPPFLVLRWYQRPDGTQSRVIHIVPLSVFVSVAEAYDPSASHPASGTETLWENWGPKKTRCFLDSKLSLPGNYCFHILFSDFTLLDFNARDIARDLQKIGSSKPSILTSTNKRRSSVIKMLRSPSMAHEKSDIEDIKIPGCSGCIVLQPNTIPKGEMFAQDVTTSLPYRRTELQWTGPEPVFVYAGEVWVVCSKEVLEDGSTKHRFHTLQQQDCIAS